MIVLGRALVAAALFGASATIAFAAASTAPTTPPQVDPSFRNATPYVLSLKVFDQCRLVQSRLMSTTQEAVHSPCSCYAKATIAGMSKDELDFMRANGYFSDSVRPRALQNLDKCNLKRPPGV
ncbi:MAG: hypothetical protein BGP06_05995 [Rhizobiales bacterium 65-9]|nr:hypothetical protein [Hyphomicrobiales bacterium]OJY35414.1 MAG: hypothetical protein BGP06_05995 [Rhizobiales bacterium 65-9]